MRLFKIIPTVAVFVLLTSAPAFALIFNFSGEITDDFGLNLFGLSTDDEIFGTTTVPVDEIDPDFFDLPISEHFYADSSVSSLQFDIGGISLTEDNDDFATAFFSEGLLTGFDYAADFTFGGLAYSFEMFGSTAGETAFTIYDNGGFGDMVLAGNFTSLQGGAAPVPEPATMLIIGTGIAGLVGSRIRRKK